MKNVQLKYERQIIIQNAFYVLRILKIIQFNIFIKEEVIYSMASIKRTQSTQIKKSRSQTSN